MPNETPAMQYLRQAILGHPVTASQIRRFYVIYDDAKHVAPNAQTTVYIAFGVQFPDGRCVLWQVLNSYTDQHQSLQALKDCYAEHGNVSVEWIDTEVK